MFIGVDIGSVSVDAVVMTGGREIVEEHYVRTKGRQIETCASVLDDMLKRTPLGRIEGIAFTGSAGRLAAQILGAFFVNEIIAQSKATGWLHPEIRTVIEIGGEDSKLIILHRDERSGAVQVRDFSMNTVCAAGTGSFIDQQANRLGLSIEEFGRLALKSTNPPRIAGRCSVFAKTDMIHLQQIATPDYDIVAGLCHALARNFKSTIGKGRDFEKPISFQGGVAANVGMVRAFETVLGLGKGELLIPKHFAMMGAIGAVLALMDGGNERREGNGEHRALNEEEETFNVQRSTANVQREEEDGEQRTENKEQTIRNAEEETGSIQRSAANVQREEEDGEQRTENKEQRIRNAEEETGNVQRSTANVQREEEDGEQRTESKEQRIRNAEEETGNVQRSTANVQREEEDGEQRTENKEQRIRNAEEETGNVQRSTSNVQREEGNGRGEKEEEKREEGALNIEHRALSIERRTSNAERRTSNVEVRTADSRSAGSEQSSTFNGQGGTGGGGSATFNGKPEDLKAVSRKPQAASPKAQRPRPAASPFAGTEPLRVYLAGRHAGSERHERLNDSGYRLHIEPDAFPVSDGPIDAFLGIDVGSISTNVVVIDREKRVLSRRYLMTAGRPIDAVRQGLDEVGGEVAGRVRICGVGTTGSGRYLTSDFVGGDVVKNEITAHARAAAHFNPNVDTIFEIGGQDSKYISLENGAVVDFTMNKVCAAGTGSFLEEQAEKLGIAIKEEFGRRALGSESPCHLGERCTVFMESDLNHQQQRGEGLDDLVAGLSYSIVLNYLNKVVEDRKVGDVIFFQGGTAYNRGVTAAFEKVTGKRIVVPPHHDCMGAIGAAIIAMEQSTGTSRFKGFDLSKRKYTIETFECKDCSNNCKVRRVSVEGERPLHYGSRCGKYDEEKRESLGKHLPRLFKERERMLMTAYDKEIPTDSTAATVGIPRIMLFFEQYPFWKAFFTELGLRVVLSEATNGDIIHDGVESVASEPCFPIKVAHGHVMNLLRRELDYIFLPSIINLEGAFEGMQRSYACPYVQSVPYLVRAAMNLDVPGTRILEPVIHMERGREHVRRVLRRFAIDELGASAGDAERAVAEAYAAQGRFYDSMGKRGREIMANLPKDAPSIVIISRPYNGCDSGMNLNIPEKLRDLGVLAIPMDFLPMDGVDLGRDFPDMYWKYGQRIIAAARIVSSVESLQALYLTCFGCGPDSFIAKFFNKEMNGKPFLTIEIDEHSADAGAVTRCEAFLDSLQHVRIGHAKPYRLRKQGIRRDHDRTIYIPYMDDHGIILAAAMRNAGLKAEALPVADPASLELGRKHTTGRECFPAIITTGDILKKATSPGFDPTRAAFFMPSALGPCRFGQYNKFHRLVLDDTGFQDAEIFILDQTKDYGKHLDTLGTNFRRRTWQAIIIVDLLQKLARQIRPYETTPGQTDRTYHHHLNALADTVEHAGDLLAAAKNACRQLAAIPVDRTVPKPKIGIVGEIFVRCNPFANNFVVRRIEQLGGEANLPPLQEWLDYIDWERKRDYTIDHNYVRLLKEHLKTCVQQRDLKRITAIFQSAITDFLHEQPTPGLIDLAAPYIHHAIRGEAVLSIGRAVEYLHKNYHGVINLAPFNCLPGNIVNALLKKFSDTHPRLPVLKLSYDGLQQASEETRLEAFMYQARQLATAQTMKNEK